MTSRTFSLSLSFVFARVLGPLTTLCFALGLAWAPKTASAQSAPLDTLEVFCLYVEFASEEVNGKDDEAATTGKGTFGSDKEISYTLDPNGESIRKSTFYLDKHFEFARNYYEKVSGGRITVVPRFFPRPNGDGLIEKPFRLPQRMKAYNPAFADKDKKQKTSDFDKEHGMRLMKFFHDAVAVAEKADSADNPFRVAKAEDERGLSERRKRAYLIFHAGHSRLVDGGGLGPLGANTPNDFTDFYVTPPDFQYLAIATKDGRLGGTPDPEVRADSLGIRLSTGDTLKNVMMLSESASQDKVNWGINGILVNQIGRALGMPDMFDVVRGFSQLGGFCMMDFAGYNSMDGFVPIYPSAWLRAFMGWEVPETARPDGSPESQYRIYAPDLGGNGRVTTLKVPLNEREYLLVENRQRSLQDSVTLYFSEARSATDVTFGKNDSVKVPFTFLDSVFSDSVCKVYQPNSTTACKTKEINKLRPRGVVTGASSYDIGLPASGLLVWRVNEWFLDLYLRYGAVNAYLCDTLRSQYKGIELVEADGFLTIGKEFKDPLGQSAFDYGSGSDMLPHTYRKRKNPPKDTTWSAQIESLTVISPYGQANTNAWNDARTHIRLEAKPSPTAKLDIGRASFTDDSVFTFRDSAMTLTVRWADNASVSRAGMAWPKHAQKGLNPTALLPLAAGGKPYVLAIGDEGFVQPYTGEGKLALAPRKVVTPPRGFDSVFTLLPSGNVRDTSPVPIASLSDSLGTPLGAAVLRSANPGNPGDTLAVAVLTAKALHLLQPLADSLAAGGNGASPTAVTGAIRVSVPLAGNGRGAGLLGPVAAAGKVWVLTDDGMLRGFGADGAPADSFTLAGAAKDWHALGAFASDGRASTPDRLGLVGVGGRFVEIEFAARRVQALNPRWGSDAPAAEERFSLAFADFDRNGRCDVVVLGSRGHVQVTSLGDDGSLRRGDPLPGWPVVVPRSVRWVDTAYRYTSEDFSPPALADLNGDKYPEIVFTALNSVYALDHRGARLPGWPAMVQPRQNVGLLYGSSGAPEAILGSTPVVLRLGGAPAIFVASPDGLILGFTAQGKRLTRSSFESAERRRMGPVSADASDWPITVGGLSIDTATTPFIRMMASALLDHGQDKALELITYTPAGGLDAFTVKGAEAISESGWLMPGGDASRSGYLATGAWAAPQAPASEERIEAFWLFPSPLRGPTATVHLEIGAAAERARIRVYGLAGNVVKTHEWRNLAPGRQPDNQVIDLKHLGPDVYTVLCEVWFPGGKKQKWERIGVVR